MYLTKKKLLKTVKKKYFFPFIPIKPLMNPEICVMAIVAGDIKQLYGVFAISLS